jgi:hypothetical protein
MDSLRVAFRVIQKKMRISLIDTNRYSTHDPE